jgi:hypothetical protein
VITPASLHNRVSGHVESLLSRTAWRSCGTPERPPIAVPSKILDGAEDTVASPGRSAGQLGLFPAGTERHVISDGGHFLPRARHAGADAMLALLARAQ